MSGCEVTTIGSWGLAITANECYGRQYSLCIQVRGTLSIYFGSEHPESAGGA
jgi:hypothetical protein